MDATTFWVARCLRLPGLGVLVLPAPPVPTWLAAPPLHATLRLQLRRAGHAPLALLATTEEVAHEGQPPARALLLDADLNDELLSPGTPLELLETLPDLLPAVMQ